MKTKLFYSEEDGSIFIENRTGSLVADIFYTSLFGIEKVKKIVKSFNNYDDIVATLKLVLERSNDEILKTIVLQALENAGELTSAHEKS